MTFLIKNTRCIHKMALQSSYKAKCYRNLNKPGVTYSIVDSSTGLVDQYANTVVLTNVSFKVSRSGQARVRKEKRKNVHAFVLGNIVTSLPEDSQLLRATYNPYIDEGFRLIDGGATLTHAKYALLCKEGLFVVL